MKVSGSGTARSANDGAAAGSGSDLVQLLFGFAEEVVGSANTLIEVRADRIKLSVRRTIVQAAIGALAGSCLALWLGDLAGGVIALTLAGGAIALCLRLSERRELERLEHKYERIRTQHDTDHDQPATAADHGAAARPGGSPGGAAARGLGAVPR